MSDGIRSDAIYVEYITRRAFYYLPNPDGEPVDKLINKVLADWLKENHPKVVEFLKQQSELDKNFRCNYSGKTPPF